VTAQTVEYESLSHLVCRLRRELRDAGQPDTIYDDQSVLAERVLDELGITGAWQRSVLIPLVQTGVSGRLYEIWAVERPPLSVVPEPDGPAPPVPRAKLRHLIRHGGAVAPTVQPRSQAAPAREQGAVSRYDRLMSLKILGTGGRRWGDLTEQECRAMISHHASREETARRRKDTRQWAVDRITEYQVTSMSQIPRSVLEPQMPDWLSPQSGV
jgi:hypothetical protein